MSEKIPIEFKRHAYGFNIETLKLMQSYLTKRWQRTKINSSFSTWSELLQGVPRGSDLGLILFNINLNDLFYLTEMTRDVTLLMTTHFMYVTRI